MTIQDNGTDLPTLLSYYNKCNRNPLCRTFVSDTTWSIVCRLYQGSIDTGTVISSLSSTSRVAGLHYDASLYGVFNQVCDSNLLAFDRYLICTNGSWNCLPTTYWNGSMCINQVYYGASCNTNKICREDIGLICSASCNKCLCQLTTIWNSTSCVPSTCPNVFPTDSSLSALWLLDGNAYDSMNNYNGTVVGRSSFITGYVGQAIALSNNSYIQTSYIDFYRQSFTIELWFYLQNTINDLPLFVECSNTDTDECLHMGLNSYSTLHFGFWNDDVDGMLKNLYITGSTSPHLYLGQSGNASIGRILPFTDEFVGYIDHVSITYRTKTTNEILDDASLVTYYSFDCGSTLDSGPNLLHGSASGQTSIIGRINRAIAFNLLSAYFQASSFTALGTSNQLFSISLWIKPLNVIGTLVHLSSTSTGNGWCTSILGFSLLGNIIAQISGTEVYGPVLALNVWTHIIHTFSVTNGIRLYINRILYSCSGSSIIRTGPNVPLYRTVANQLLGAGTCNSGNIISTLYAGAIDELCVYNACCLHSLYFSFLFKYF